MLTIAYHRLGGNPSVPSTRPGLSLFGQSLLTSLYKAPSLRDLYIDRKANLTDPPSLASSSFLRSLCLHDGSSVSDHPRLSFSEELLRDPALQSLLFYLVQPGPLALSAIESAVALEIEGTVVP